MNTKITQLTFPHGFLDLGTGIPSLDLLPMDKLKRAADSYFEEGDRRTLQYGAEQGSGIFLEGLAEWLTAATGTRVDTGGLMTTGGASAALDLICTLYTRPGDVVFVEEPTYFLALRIFADHDLQVETVTLDEEGLNLDDLEDKLRRVKPSFLYTIPTFHNPASVSLSPKRRKRLVNLAQEHDFLVLADEVYRFLNYTTPPAESLGGFSAEVEQVISLNSFSKILAPGLRLGWIQAHPRVIEKLSGSGMLDSGGGFNPFTSAVVDQLIRKGDLTANIQKVREIYRQRLRVMDQALAEHLPEADFGKPQGGYYFWVRLAGQDTSGLREQAREAQVDFRPGSLFSARNGLNEYFRLSFSYCSEHEIIQGIKLLAELGSTSDP